MVDSFDRKIGAGALEASHIASWLAHFLRRRDLMDVDQILNLMAFRICQIHIFEFVETPSRNWTTMTSATLDLAAPVARHAETHVRDALQDRRNPGR